MEVNSSNFEEVFPKFCSLLKSCSFAAIDLEFTGIPNEKTSFLDLPEAVYFRARKAATKFFALQFGCCVFLEQENGSWEAHPFSFYLFPPVREERAVQTSAIQFLGENGFDFNKSFVHGIKYLNVGSEKRKKIAVEKSEPTESRSFIAVKTEKDKKLVQDIEDLLKSICENGKVASDLLDAEYVKEEIYKDFYVLRPQNNFLRRIIYQTVEKFSKKNLICDTIDGAGRLALKMFDSEKAVEEYKKQKLERSLRRLEQEVGFRRVLDALKFVPITGHNCLLDLVYTSQMIDEVPENLEEFKAQVNFKSIYDTKLISETFFGNEFVKASSLSDLHEVLEKNQVLNLKTVDLDAKYHDASWDAYVTGSVFLR